MNSNVVRTKGGVVHSQILRGIEKLGNDISDALRVRRISVEDFAQRIGISRATMFRLERGDPVVSLHTLAMGLHALGRLDALASLAGMAADDIGLMLSRREAPEANFEDAASEGSEWQWG